MSDELDNLIRSTPHLWQGNRSVGSTFGEIPTGYSELDQALPGEGWPRGVVIELVLRTIGIGELRLILPVIRALVAHQRFIVMINAPYIPYAPALNDAGVDLGALYSVRSDSLDDGLWAAEKALLNPLCGMVVLWSGTVHRKNYGDLKDTVVRRLQVAAQASHAILVLYRVVGRGQADRQNPWAAIRLSLARQDGNLVIDILKTQGGCRRSRVCLNLEHDN